MIYILCRPGMSGSYAKIYGQLIYFKELVCRRAQRHDIWAVPEHHGSWAAIQFSEKFKLFPGWVSLLAWREIIRNVSSNGRVSQVLEWFCSSC